VTRHEESRDEDVKLEGIDDISVRFEVTPILEDATIPHALPNLQPFRVAGRTIATLLIALVTVGCNFDTTPVIDTLRIDRVNTTVVEPGTLLEIEGRFTGGTLLALCDAPLEDQAFALDADAAFIPADQAVERALYTRAQGIVPSLTPGATCELRVTLDGEPLPRQDDEVSVTVRVAAELPGQIRDVEVRDGNGEAFLTFDAPNDGGSTILRYEIRILVAGDYAPLSPTDDGAYRVPNLENGVTYPAVVRAVNDVGAGPASAFFTLAPFTTPSAPDDLRVAATPIDLTLSFEPAQANGRPVTHYAYRLNRGAWTSVPATSATDTLLIEDVNHDTTYRIDLRARNEAGEGAYTTTSAATPLRIVHVGAGEEHSLAIDAYGRLWTWGENFDGHLGNGDTEDVAQPTLVAQGPFQWASGGANYSAALASDGAPWTWGSQYYSTMRNSVAAW